MNEQSLFIEALEKHDPAVRGAFLDQMCAGDPALRQRLERLLQHHQRADSFLDPPTSAWPAFVELIRERHGTVIGPYKLLQQIGEGGMGIVFMAEQQQPVRRKVALKIIKPGMDSRQVVARFEAERQALAMMDHQNIARVLDAGTTADGRPYFVMELVYGVPITTYCDDNHLTVRERLELFVPVCKAIQHAHQKGIIHRDLKPSNILVCLYDGQPVPKVIDFGVAKAVEQRLTERTLFTQYGQIIGTFEYMSPEQAEMSQLGVDTRSDIYSLGVLLYELLTGSTPFERLQEAGLTEVLRTIKEDDPPRPSARLSSTQEAAKIASARRTEPVKLAKLMRGELDWIVMKALEKDRGRRYETANGLARDLQRYLADEPVEACPPSARYRLWKFVRKYRSVLAMAGAIVLLLVVIAAGASLAAWRLERERDRAVAHQRAAEQAEEQSKEQLWKALLASAGQSLEWPARPNFDSLDALTQAAALRPSLELRNEAIACMALPDLRLARQANLGIPRGYGLAFDAELERYAFSDEQGTISLRCFADNRELLRLPGGGAPAWMLKFSPDGRFLAARCHCLNGDTNTILVWDISEGRGARDEGRGKTSLLSRPSPLAPRPSGLIGRFWDFHPNKPYVAASCEDGSLQLYDLSGRRPTVVLSQNEPAYALAFDPEGSRLAVGRDSPLIDSGERVYPIFVHDVETGKCLFRLRAPAQVRELAWHQDGRRLTGAALDSNIYVWELPSERPVKTLFGHENSVSNVAFHPGGELLASVGWDGVARLWNAETGRQLLSGPAADGSLRFSRDGRRLALLLDPARVGLYDINPEPVCRTLYGHNETGAGLWSAAFHPHKPLLVTTCSDCVRLWDAQSGREIATQPLSVCQSAFFLPDGDLVTSGASGPERWRLMPLAGADPGRARLERLPWGRPIMRDTRRMALAADGRTLAVLIENRQAVVLGGERWTQRLLDLSAPQVSSIALSPNGRWAAAGTWRGNGTRIWDLHGGQQIGTELPGGDAFVIFSSDGRWLVNGTETEYRFWEVGSWRPGLRIPRTPPTGAGPLAFSADGKILAIAHSFREVRLIETTSGRELATLAAPEPHPIRWLCFRPDGEQLAVACEKGVLQLWNLRRLQERLAERRLNWQFREESEPRSSGSGAFFAP